MIQYPTDYRIHTSEIMHFDKHIFCDLVFAKMTYLSVTNKLRFDQSYNKFFATNIFMNFDISSLGGKEPSTLK